MKTANKTKKLPQDNSWLEKHLPTEQRQRVIGVPEEWWSQILVKHINPALGLAGPCLWRTPHAYVYDSVFQARPIFWYCRGAPANQWHVCTDASQAEALLDRWIKEHAVFIGFFTSTCGGGSLRPPITEETSNSYLWLALGLRHFCGLLLDPPNIQRALAYTSDWRQHPLDKRGFSAFCALITEPPSPNLRAFSVTILVTLQDNMEVVGFGLQRTCYQDDFWFVTCRRNSLSAHLSGAHTMQQAYHWLQQGNPSGVTTVALTMQIDVLSANILPTLTPEEIEDSQINHVLWDDVQRTYGCKRREFHRLLQLLVNLEFYGAVPTYLSRKNYNGSLPNMTKGRPFSLINTRIRYLNYPFECDIERTWNHIPLHDSFSNCVRTLLYRWLYFGYGSTAHAEVHWRLTTHRLFFCLGGTSNPWYVCEGDLNQIMPVNQRTARIGEFGELEQNHELLLLTSDDMARCGPPPSIPTMEITTLIDDWLTGERPTIHCREPHVLNQMLRGLHDIIHSSIGEQHYVRLRWNSHIPNNAIILETLMQCDYAISMGRSLKTIQKYNQMPIRSAYLIATRDGPDDLCWTLIYRHCHPLTGNVHYTYGPSHNDEHVVNLQDYLPHALLLTWTHYAGDQ